MTGNTILAIDAGFRKLGWAVFGKDGDGVACGVISTSPSDKRRRVRAADDNAMRAAKIARELHDVIQQYQVRVVVCELPSGGAQSARAMAQMSMAAAIVAVVVELNSLPCEWVTPTEVKLALHGTKTASKDDMIEVAARRWGEMVFPGAKCDCEHVADACGAYLAASEHGGLVRLFSGT